MIILLPTVGMPSVQMVSTDRTAKPGCRRGVGSGSFAPTRVVALPGLSYLVEQLREAGAWHVRVGRVRLIRPHRDVADSSDRRIT